MKKTIIKIIISLLIILAIIVMPFIIIFSENKNGISIESEKMKIQIEDEEISIINNIELKISKNANRIKINNAFESSYNIESFKVDGKTENINEYIIQNSTGKDQIKNIEIKYTLEDSDVKQYTDVTYLEFIVRPNRIDYAKNIEIEVNFNEPNTIFEASSFGIFKNIKTEKTSDMSYNLHISKTNLLDSRAVSIIFDKDKTNIGTIRNEVYMENREYKKQQFAEQNHYALILTVSIILTIISYIIYFTFTIKNRKTKEIKREWEDLLSPVLAETVVDGKTEIKDLIMTVVVDLVVRGNIEVINNDTIKLKNKENITEYEEIVINILFENNEIVNFSKFKEIFIKMNSKTEDIYSYVSLIKDYIIQELNAKGVLSQNKKMCMTVLRNILKLNIAVIIIAMAGIISTNIFISIVAIFLISLIFKVGRNEENTELYSNGRIKISLIMFAIVAFIGIVANITNAFAYNIIFIAIILLDIILIIISRKEYFTKKGREERRKILEFKNYLEEYSIIEEKNLKDTIIWDKYLAYATAFGMNNNITKKFYESYMNVNIALQKFEKYIKIF